MRVNQAVVHGILAVLVAYFVEDAFGFPFGILAYLIYYAIYRYFEEYL